ncbi:hypothetical protein FA15DRAFT_757210 [Coprinopsis marcescibilis]|uniref:Uncharacterized protein n=1 Tax=Coprinopsis marcescibilis TaxID=230819 RepID=A0A5C3KSD5_COPMA|nr:hypothetical protein FA15DRAFT_757210 [Coprinopsis marcescibilis]
MFGKAAAISSNISFKFSFLSNFRSKQSAEPSEHRSAETSQSSRTDRHTANHASTSSNIHLKQQQPATTIHGTPIIRKPKPKRPRIQIPSQPSTSTKTPKAKSKSKSNTNPQPQQKQKQKPEVSLNSKKKKRKFMIISERGRPQLKLQIPQYTETAVASRNLEPSETRRQIVPTATNLNAKGRFEIGGRPMFPVYQVEVRPLNVAQKVGDNEHS